jgi:hypothetical protein
MKITWTNLKKLSQDTVANPRKDPIASMVAEVEDANYYETQATILIKQAADLRKGRFKKADVEQYNKLMSQAGQLLLMARCVIN